MKTVKFEQLKDIELEVWNAFQTPKLAEKFFTAHFNQKDEYWNCAKGLVMMECYCNPFKSIEFIEKCKYYDWNDFVILNSCDWYFDEYGIDPESMDYCKFNRDDFILSRLEGGSRVNKGNPLGWNQSLSEYIFTKYEFVIKLPNS